MCDHTQLHVPSGGSIPVHLLLIFLWYAHVPLFDPLSVISCFLFATLVQQKTIQIGVDLFELCLIIRLIQKYKIISCV
jgi:hypothetical protein